MIYLIDDKKLRQKIDFCWTEEKFNKLKDSIQPIYDLGELEKRSAEIFQNGNIILYHESFLDNTSLKHQASFKRDKLDKFIQKNDKSLMAFFSGSKDIRSVDNRIAYLPVSVLYENLEMFIEQHKVDNNDLLFLLYGNNPYIEQELTGMLDKAIAQIDRAPASLNSKFNLFISTDEKFIDNPIVDVDEQTLYFEETDEELHELIHEWLGKKKFNNIFIPLCFGSSLSDFNGLRFATHIRCTQNQNQFANIFIYSFVGIEYLLNNAFFNILKTENVHLVDFKKTAFQSVANECSTEIKVSNFSQELLKLKLTPPGNYYDSHSIANEWSVLRWSEVILSLVVEDELPEEIEIIENQIKSNIYFKYLQSIYPIQEQFKLTIKDLKLNYTGKLLYIDDEKEKGWNELFCYLFWEEKINKIEYFDSIGGDFKNLKKNEIIQKSVERAKDFDVVILDFRLTQDDFYQNDPKEITGYKILEGIKAINKGIQVIIFSASNKIWNLQSLQDAGADGFIIKESPENSIDQNFTKQTIINFINTVDECLRMSFLKVAFNYLNSINIQVSKISNSNNEAGLSKLTKLKLKNEVHLQIQIVFDCLRNIRTRIFNSEFAENYLNLAFISLYKIIELLNDYYTSDSGKTLKSDNTPIMNYDNKINQFKKITNQHPSALDKILTIIDKELFLDVSKYFNRLIDMNRIRVNIIHPKNLKDYHKSTVEENLTFIKLLNELIQKVK